MTAETDNPLPDDGQLGEPVARLDGALSRIDACLEDRDAPFARKMQTLSDELTAERIRREKAEIRIGQLNGEIAKLAAFRGEADELRRELERVREARNQGDASEKALSALRAARQKDHGELTEILRTLDPLVRKISDA